MNLNNTMEELAQNKHNDNHTDTVHEYDKWGQKVYVKLTSNGKETLCAFAQHCKTNLVLNLDGIMIIDSKFLDAYQPTLDAIDKIRILTALSSVKREMMAHNATAAGNSGGDIGGNLSNFGVIPSHLAAKLNNSRGFNATTNCKLQRNLMNVDDGLDSVNTRQSTADLSNLVTPCNLDLGLNKFGEHRTRPGGFTQDLDSLSSNQLNKYRSNLKAALKKEPDDKKQNLIYDEIYQCNKISQKRRKESSQLNKIWMKNLVQRDPRRQPKQYMFDLVDYHMFWRYYTDPITKQYYQQKRETAKQKQALGQKHDQSLVKIHVNFINIL